MSQAKPSIRLHIQTLFIFLLNKFMLTSYLIDFFFPIYSKYLNKFFLLIYKSMNFITNELFIL